jgi:hypothetical protein
VIGAAAALVSAAVHLYLWLDGVKDHGTAGTLFMLNVVAGVVIAGLLLRWGSWIPLFLLAGFGAATFGAFLIAVSDSLLGIHTHWSGWAVVAAISEIAAIIGAVVAARQEGYLGRITAHDGVRARHSG